MEHPSDRRGRGEDEDNGRGEVRRGEEEVGARRRSGQGEANGSAERSGAETGPFANRVTTSIKRDTLEFDGK